MNWLEWVTGAAGFLLTVMVLSYLIGDNVFFRLAASIFIGVTAGYLAVLLIRHILWPFLIQPLIYEPWQTKLWLGIPLLLIFLLLISQFPRMIKLGRIPLAYLAGLSGGIAIIGAVFGTLLPQSMAVINVFDAWAWTESSSPLWREMLEGAVMLVGVIGVLSYFYFGRKRNLQKEKQAEQRPAIFEAFSQVGQVFIGITLGSVFASLFSSALLALIDRIAFIGKFIMNLFRGF